MDCEAVSSLEDAILEDGYWRTGADSAIVVKCVHGVKACKSGAPPARRLLIADGSEAAHDARTLAATSFVVGAGFYCAEGHEGPLCAVCSEDYFLDAGAGKCENAGAPLPPQRSCWSAWWS